MRWNEIVMVCLKQRLKDEEVVLASLTVELRVQERLVEQIKEELKKEEEKGNERERK